MKTSVKFSKILAVILAAMLMLTLLTATVFAETGTGEANEDTSAVTGETTGDVTGETTGEDTEDGSDGDETTADPSSETTKAPASETTASSGSSGSSSKINWVDIIVSASIIVLAALAFTICYFVIPKFRARVQKFFGDYKSELKKVTWSSKEEVKRNTITVVVIIAAVAIVIALLDVIFSGGIEALGRLF